MENLAKEVLGYTQMLAYMHELGTVVSRSVRFGPLANLGIDLDKVSPQLINNTLHFITMEMGVYQETHPLHYIRWHLSDLTMERCKVVNFEDLESGKSQWNFAGFG